MDPITTPSASNNAPAVDSILNDILSGKPVDDSSAPTVAVPSPDPHAFPSSPTMSKDSGAVANHIHDVLEGTSDSQRSVAPGMTPVVKESSLEPSPTPSRLPLGDSEPGVPFGVRPVPVPSMPTTPLTPEVPAMPVTPLSPVSPTTASAPQTVSNEGGEKFQVAQAPKAGMPKATIAATIAVIAVVLGGVGAGVALSGQNQDLRNQAYVAPAQRNSPAVVQSAPVAVVPPTIEESFQAFQVQYPQAQKIAVSGELAGTIYLAQDEALGMQQLFIEVSELPETSNQYFAWVTVAGESLQLSQFTVGETGKAYATGLIPASAQNSEVVISLETPGSEGFGLLPTRKIMSIPLAL